MLNNINDKIDVSGSLEVNAHVVEQVFSSSIQFFPSRRTGTSGAQYPSGSASLSSSEELPCLMVSKVTESLRRTNRIPPVCFSPKIIHRTAKAVSGPCVCVLFTFL